MWLMATVFNSTDGEHSMSAEMLWSCAALDVALVYSKQLSTHVCMQTSLTTWPTVSGKYIIYISEVK